MNTKPQRPASLAAAPCWPTFSEYVGGGTILREWNASESNLETYCDEESREQVRDMIRRGYDVIVLRGKIVAAEKDKFRSANGPS